MHTYTQQSGCVLLLMKVIQMDTEKLFVQTVGLSYTQKSYFYINPKSDCIYHFPVDSDPNGRPFVSKSIGKW